MKTRTTYSVSLVGALLGLASFAAPPQGTTLQAVGPKPGSSPVGQGSGYLQVHSAKVQGARDLSAEMFFWNNDFGRNEFVRGLAHTSYSVYTLDGKLVSQISNSAGPKDSTPTVVDLQPGAYRIQAKAEQSPTVSSTVIVPVHIQAGATTVVHLAGDWNPPVADRANLVQLPNGSFVGWKASIAQQP